MIVDIIILALVVLAAAQGLRRGAAVQLLTIVGFLAGLAGGALLVVVVAPHIHGQVAKTTVSLAVLLIPAAVAGAIGTQVGAHVARFARHVRLGAVDAIVGATLSTAGMLIVCWLFASILVNTTYSALSEQIESSRVIREVQQIMPPVPNAFSAVERYLSTSGFPQVLVNMLPEATGPVNLPSNAELRAAAQADALATVKVVALGCGDEQEGSGFVAATSASGDLVVTNAHVVAGTSSIDIYVQNGKTVAASPVLFDPKFDLAILKTPPLSVPALPIDPSFINRGTAVVELGYPEGGPYTADKAGVIARFAAQGRDIYDASLTVRTVYELAANVRPGNSGGPLISPSGAVEGVVFSRSESERDVGFALASPGVARRLSTVSISNNTVSTEGCTS